MTTRLDRNGLQVDARLAAFVEQQALPDIGITPAGFWAGLAGALADLAPQNRALLARRDALQTAIDTWFLARKGQPFDAAAHEAFLREIGYIQPEGPDFRWRAANTDPRLP